jgi:fatty acyl-CoA reductase
VSSVSIAEGLTGKRLFISGATGFVGTALLERVLSALPDTRIVLLIRPRGSRSALQRCRALLAETAFGPLRERWGAPALERACAERVTVVDGDLVTGGFSLPDDLDVVVHCAADVAFDRAFDTAFGVNVFGVHSLYSAVVASGSRPHLVHVSTAYVAGLRRGPIPEGPSMLNVAWQAEAGAIAGLRAAAEADSRRPDVLEQLARRARTEHGQANPIRVTRAVEDARQDWVASSLAASGRARARSLGFPDVYGLTKAFGEQVVEGIAREHSLPLSIMRPAITESSLLCPYPGWIKGFKMADPIIHAFGRGDLPDSPAVPDGAVDILPVDLVVNAILAASVRPPVDRPAYYHLASGGRNPLRFRHLYDLGHQYFGAQPLEERGRPIRPPHWTFPGISAIERRLRFGEWAVEKADEVLGWLPVSSARANRMADEIDRQRRRLVTVRRQFDIFGPYVSAEMTYLDHNTQTLLRSLAPVDRDAFDFDCAHIEWPDYMLNIHFPAIRRQPHPSGGARQAARLHPLDRPVLAVFDLDGTLLETTVVETYLWARLRDLPARRWLGEVVEVASQLPGYVTTEHGDRGQFLRLFYRRYRGASRAELERLVDDELAALIWQRLAPAGLRRVREHRAAGHQTVLLTGALDIFTRPLAPLFDHMQAARLAIADGCFTGDLEAPPLAGEARLAWLEVFAREQTAKLDDAYAYADSFSDVPLLAGVGHPTVVNPDVRLYRLARRRRWPVEDWRVRGADAVRPTAERVS